MKSVYKIVISILLILALVFVLVACGGNTEEKVVEQDNNNDINISTPRSEESSETTEVPKEEPEEETEEDIGEAFLGAEFLPVEEEIVEKGKEEVRSLTSIEKALIGDDLVGYRILISPNGYGGPMEIYTYIDTSGSIVKVEVGQHNETVGVGDQVNQPKFLNKFIGINDESKISSIDGVSGATFSTGGVKDGIKRALLVYENLLK